MGKAKIRSDHARPPEILNEALSMYVRSQDPSEMTEKQKRWNIRFSVKTEGCSKKKNGTVTYINQFRFEHLLVPKLAPNQVLSIAFSKTFFLFPVHLIKT